MNIFLKDRNICSGKYKKVYIYIYMLYVIFTGHQELKQLRQESVNSLFQVMTGAVLKMEK